MQHVSEILPAIAQAKGIRNSDLKLSEAAAAIRQAPPDELAFMAKELVQCTLPHSDPGNVPRWSRTNGDLTVTLTASVDGYPYGSIPRLLLFWLTAEVKRTGSRRIRLGDSFYEFLAAIGLNPSNGSGARSDRKRVDKQIRRTFGTAISFSSSDGSREQRWNMVVASQSVLWWDPIKPGQFSLWESWVELGYEFSLAIADSVPLDWRPLRALKRSPLALDLYAWAAYKVYSMKRNGVQSQFVPWKGLHGQFGGDYGTVKNFRVKARNTLIKIRTVYPGLEVKFVPGGLVVLPSSLAVPAKAWRLVVP